MSKDEEERNLYVVYVVAGAVLVLLLAFIIKLAASGSGPGGKRDVILLLGPCGGGKTALFHRLRDGPTKVDTVTSMKETLETFPLFDEDAATVSVLDFPGHERLRSQVSQFYPIAKKLVFVVDATTIGDAAQVRKAAEFLYDIFVHPKLHDNGIPLLVACSKADMSSAATPANIQTILEAELSQLKSTRASLETHDDDESIPLGRENVPFAFDVDAPCEVVFEGYSIHSADAIAPLLDFILQE
ncbi:hypothetical protein H257_11974 [Aphanomyces astaci]|uniref:Signal recognition particle receptor subunit beta n=1 Tax=Aphanomyces astaci TaxID=112090 RepID=W4G1K6_APHAT|nr:hypothetical protein H257_11974 [Aphanomyces astaci]ETV73156.1 hypothetical protein H257_11974 [Aphanomyces astaci]|eukprot:XP_009837361.1 hypothetical protein H257_11974 [Aphanomyces astaci]